MGLLEIVSVFFSLASFTHPGYLEIPPCCGVDVGVVLHSVMYLGCVSAHLQVALGVLSRVCLKWIHKFDEEDYYIHT